MALSPDVQETFFSEVVASLGGTLVDVELTYSDLTICFNKAVRTYQQKGQNALRRMFISIPVTAGTYTYDVPPGIDTVVKIVKPSTSFYTGQDLFAISAMNDLWGSVTQGGNGCGCSCSAGFDMLTYEFALDRIERLKRMTAYDAQFQFDRFKNTITLLKAPPADGTWLLDAYMNLDDDEYCTRDWIIRWTIAEAKHMLGMAYRKFPSLPSPTGEINLSGSEYLQESATEKEQLLNDILNFDDGEIDFYEIVVG